MTVRLLELSSSDRDLLASVWENAGRPSLRVDPADVEAASEAVGSAIPDLVLAIVIAEGRNPGALVELTRAITAFYDAGDHNDWRRAAQFDHVAFAALPTDDESEPVYACFARTTNAHDVGLFLWNLREAGRGAQAFADLGAYVKRRDALAVARGNGAAFRPVVEATPKAVTGDSLVVHKRFGEGRIVEQLEDGKVRIDFGANGVRVLAASFVTAKA